MNQVARAILSGSMCLALLAVGPYLLVTGCAVPTDPTPEPQCAAADEACTDDADCCTDLVCGDDGTCQAETQPTQKTFAGAAACTECHEEAHDGWMGTLHADALASLEASESMADYCIACHTVGYGEGGFVSREETPEYANVQCENCHGAAQAHVDDPENEALYPPSSIGSDVCGQCHTGSHHPNTEQWEESGHATLNENVAEDLLAGGFYVNSCGVCHSGDVFVEAIVEGGEVADDRFAGMSEEDLNTITCVTCHTSHDKTGHAVDPTEGRDYQLRFPEVAEPDWDNDVADVQDRSRFNLCGQCHHSRGRTWQDTSRGPHHSVQANVYLGEMATPEGEEPLVANTESSHDIVPAQCATCHMFRKDYESEEAPTISGHLFTVDTEGCGPCHSAEEAQEQLDAIETEVQAALDDIAMRLGEESTWQYSATGGPPEADDAEDGQASQDDLSDNIKKVRFIYSYIVSDGSYGVHNPDYVRAMLELADTLLTEEGL